MIVIVMLLVMGMVGNCLDLKNQSKMKTEYQIFAETNNSIKRNEFNLGSIIDSEDQVIIHTQGGMETKNIGDLVKHNENSYVLCKVDDNIILLGQGSTSKGGPNIRTMKFIRNAFKYLKWDGKLSSSNIDLFIESFPKYQLNKTSIEGKH